MLSPEELENIATELETAAKVVREGGLCAVAMVIQFDTPGQPGNVTTLRRLDSAERDGHLDRFLEQFDVLVKHTADWADLGK
jgi:hypothetical protein